MQGFVPKIINCFTSFYTTNDDDLVRRDSTCAVYTCPEFIRDETLQFDGKCDIFSFGIILFELLSGQFASKKQDWDIDFVLWSDTNLAQSLLDLAKLCTANRSTRIGNARDLLKELKDLQDSISFKLTVKEQELVDTMSESMGIVKGKLENQRSMKNMTHGFGHYDSEDSDLSEDEEVFNFDCAVCLRQFFDEIECIPCSGQIDKHSMCKRCFSDKVKSQSSDLEQFKGYGRKIVCPLCIHAKPKKKSAYISKVIYNCADDVAIANYLKVMKETEPKC